MPSTGLKTRSFAIVMAVWTIDRPVGFEFGLPSSPLSLRDYSHVKTNGVMSHFWVGFFLKKFFMQNPLPRGLYMGTYWV